MLVTPEKNRRNQIQALLVAGISALLVGLAGWGWPPLWIGLVFCTYLYWLLRRRCLRRLAVMQQPFPAAWEEILQTHVRFFQALGEPQKERFRQLVKVFLAEVTITGIRTEVDDSVRVLVAASAVIPIFGFHDWEYSRLGEVLVYPTAFGEAFQMKGGPDEDTLGMVGLHHLSGVMILSKPALLSGFDDRSSQQVGIHEFVHLVEEIEANRGIPPEVPVGVVQQWVQYVAKELAHPQANRAYLNDYAYKNEHEFLAVLAEYFFKSPELLRQKDPQLYGMLRAMFHQDPGLLYALAPGRRRGYDRSAPCPCGSGRKYKDCCLLKPAVVAGPSETAEEPNDKASR
jgi:Mlc titration factor MtfA (ptsG expression regulator)